jgi:hypothetical protein
MRAPTSGSNSKNRSDGSGANFSEMSNFAGFFRWSWRFREDALVFESDCGAICDLVEEVWVAPRGSRHGDEVAWFDDAVRSGSAWGVNAKWDLAHHLVIEYLSAGQGKLLMRKTVIAEQDVQISMRDGISDSLAPAGEMLDHLRSTPEDRLPMSGNPCQLNRSMQHPLIG